MKWKSILLSSSLSLFFVGMLAFFLNAQESNQPRIFSEQRPLYIIHARTARISMDNETSGTLTLKSLGESVAFFSNENYRKAGTLSLVEFVESWDDGRRGFHSHTPEGALVFFAVGIDNTRRREYTEINLFLKEPQYSPIFDTLSFTFDLMDNKIIIPENRLLEPTLFIE